MHKMEKLNKKEPILFYLLLLIHLLPVIILTPFVSLDGAAHLYNGRLLHTLIFENSSIVNRFFEFNPIPQPNWICQTLTALLLTFLPAWLTEKIIIILIIISGAIGFRLLTVELNTKSGWMSWLYFPMIYNFPFSLGFYNYSIGFSLLPFILLFWIRNRNIKFNSLQFALLIIATIVLYFCHILIILFAGFFMFFITMNDYRLHDKKKIVNQIKSLIIIFLPILTLSIWVIFFTGSSSNPTQYNTFMDRINDIISAGFLVFFDFNKDAILTRTYFLTLIGITLWSLKNYSIQSYQKALLGITICCFLLIFIIPESLASGSVITVRVVQVFYLAWMIWLITLNIPIKGRVVIAFISVLFSLVFSIRNFTRRKDLSDFAITYFEAAERMEKGSIVVPLNYDSNWLHNHLCDYMGVEKDIVVLRNYEAVSKAFPLVWKKGMDPELHLGDFPASKKPCINIANFEKFSGLKINYITVQMKPYIADDSCTKSTFKQLDSLFEPLPLWNNSDVRIYKRRIKS